MNSNLRRFAHFVGSQVAENKVVEVTRTVAGIKSVKNDMRLK